MNEKIHRQEQRTIEVAGKLWKELESKGMPSEKIVEVLLVELEKAENEIEFLQVLTTISLSYANWAIWYMHSRNISQGGEGERRLLAIWKYQICQPLYSRRLKSTSATPLDARTLRTLLYSYIEGSPIHGLSTLDSPNTKVLLGMFRDISVDAELAQYSS